MKPPIVFILHIIPPRHVIDSEEEEEEEEEEHEFIWLHNKKYTIVVIVQR